MKGEDFPDQPQIELIRERLWSAREFGRTSVMVGAGFSKNAQGTSPLLSSFPSWGELASVMYEALYPPNRSDAASWREAKKVATSGTGAMSLSSEYEALFGRAALDDLVSRSIPDERFEPGPLHSRLLSLPWSDVFTTNYDTLLERARTHPEVYERKYELVLTPADLPLRAKPRIVKLHGTLPSHRPFIITEVALPPPLRTFSDTTSPSFDPDRVTTTVNFPSGFSAEPILPAFALLRMVEDGAVPPRVANVNSFSETAMVATRWTESYTPLWSVCSEVRYGPASKKLYERFDRVRVATMPQEVVDHLSRVLIGALARSVEQLQYNSAEADFGSSSFAHRQVLVASELLSRLYFRLSAGQQDEVFDLALGMYRMPLFQARHWPHSGIASLFERMLAAETSGDGLLARVPTLLDLPVPGEPGVEVRLKDTWVEPLQHTVWDRNERFESGLDPTVASPAIDRLIRLTREGAPGSRRRAVARLGALHNMRVLTEEEERGFGEALWTRVSSDTGLPEDTDLYDYAFLYLQEPEPGRAARAFRELMQPRDFTQMVADGDGESRITAFSTGHGDDPYTRNILRATAPRMRDDDDPGGYVDWTLEEIESILHKVARRWDSEKEELRSRIAAGSSEGHFARIVTQRLEGWLAILSRVVLPSIGDADERVRETARRLVLEMDEPGALASSALPALLHVAPGDFEEVANKFRDRINDNDTDRVGAVALGISLWLQHAAADGIPSPPEDLLDSLISRMLSRKQVAMDTILGSLRVMLEKLSGTFDEAKLEGLSLALGHLLEDTQLPAYEDREREDRLGNVIPVELRSRHRQLAAQLAYRLHLEFTRRSLEIPDVLEHWRQACSQDPLPEVRRAWLGQG